MELYNKKALDYLSENYNGNCTLERNLVNNIITIKIGEVDCCFEESYLADETFILDLKEKSDLLYGRGFINSKAYKRLVIKIDVEVE